MSPGDRQALSSDLDAVAMTTEAAVSEKIIALGRRLGMNTDLRRSVFYAIMTSDVCAPSFTVIYFFAVICIYILEAEIMKQLSCLLLNNL